MDPVVLLLVEFSTPEEGFEHNHCKLLEQVIQAYLFIITKALLLIIINIIYLITSVFVIRLTLLFIEWFKLRHNLIFLLYFFTIAF